MTTYLYNRYDVYAAEEATYGAGNADPSAYQQLRPEADGFEHGGKTDLLERKLVRTDLLPMASVPGAPSCTVKLKCPARGGGGMTSINQDASLCSELAPLLRACVGSERADITAVLSGGTSQGVTVSGATPSDYFTLGGLVFIDPTGNGPMYGRWISDMDNMTSTLTVSGDWSGGDAWNMAQTATAAGMAHSAVQLGGGMETLGSVTMQINGMQRAGSRAIWSYSGLVGNLKIDDSDAQKRVLLSVELSGDGYDVHEGAATVSTETGAAAWPMHPTDIVALSADLRINGTPVAYRSFSLNLGNAFAERSNANAATGRDAMILTEQAPSGSVQIYWDAAHYGKLKSGECIDVSWIVGTASNGVGFHAPRCEIRNVKERDMNGLLGMDISFVVLDSHMNNIPAWNLAFSGGNSTL